MDYKHTCDTIYTHFQGITNNIYGFGRPFLAPSFLYPSTHIFTRPYSFLPFQMNDGWTGLCIKLWKKMWLANLSCDGTLECPPSPVTVTAAVTAAVTLVRVMALPVKNQTNKYKLYNRPF